MLEPATCIRLFADDAGESHFEDIEFEMASILYAPPAPALELSEPVPVRRLSWFRFPDGWSDSAHPSPRRQIFILLEGEVECWTSSGEMRVLKAGDRLLMEDTTGKGHGARPVNGTAFAAMIALE